MGNGMSHTKRCWIPRCFNKGSLKFGGRCYLHQHANLCQATDCNGLAYDLKRYCPECNCPSPDCDQIVLKDQQYCQRHQDQYICLMTNCNNPVNKDDEVCLLHQCAFENCQKIVRMGYYCPLHTCQMGQCDKAVFGNYSFCYAHYNLIEKGLIEYNLHFIPEKQEQKNLKHPKSLEGPKESFQISYHRPNKYVQNDFASYDPSIIKPKPHQKPHHWYSSSEDRQTIIVDHNHRPCYYVDTY